MLTIWKYEVELTDESTVWLPMNAKILDIDYQPPSRLGALENGKKLTLWAMVDSDEKSKTNVKVRIIGTGHKIEDLNGFTFFKTVHSMKPFVWHIFIKSSFVTIA